MGIMSYNSNMNRKGLYLLVALLLLILHRDLLYERASHIIFIIAVLFTCSIMGFHKKTLKNISLILLSTITAFLVGFVRYPSLYDVFKDFFFLTQPIIAILMGSIIAIRFNKETLIKAVTICSSILAIYFLSDLLVNQSINRILSPRETRDALGGVGFSPIILFSLGLYLYKYLYNRDSLRRTDYWFFIIQLLCLYTSASRTYWVCFVIVVICVFSKWIFGNTRRVIGGSILTILLISGILAVSPTLRQTIQRSLLEARIGEYKTAQDINNHYRGYEAYMVQKAFEKQPAANKIIGAGMGTLIDVKNQDLVGLRYIPITHNGYMFILIKLGYFGMIAYILWSIFTIRTFLKTPTTSKDDEVIKIWAVASVFCLMFSNYVIWGLFNVEMNIAPILIGAAMTYNYQNKQKV